MAEMTLQQNGQDGNGSSHMPWIDCGNGKKLRERPMAEKWTQKMVAEQLEEAVTTLQRLPMPGSKPAGYGTSWPPVIREFCEAYGWNEAEFRTPHPLPEAITRMDNSLEWLRWLAPEEIKLVWLRAERRPWKEIARHFGVGRTTAWSRWMAVLLQIATTLNAHKNNLNEKKVFEQRV
ncbi:MAG: hypothetical protein HQL97_16985, partial [Magnetococcales bacterium]|nr:hypothetical protein [Magnetococcales bacterium]